MHIVCWTPVLILLLIKRPFFDASDNRWYRIWSAVLMVFIVFSFIFDIRDAAIYIGHLATE